MSGVWAIHYTNQIDLTKPKANRFLLTCNEAGTRGGCFSLIKAYDGRWFVYVSAKIFGKWRSRSWLQKKA